MIQYFLQLAKYNQWANDLIYSACSQLSTKEYFKTRPSFFKSIHGTLNHIMVGDLVWLSRLGYETNQVTKLSQELFPTLDSLWLKRKELDNKILDFVSKLAEIDLKKELQYQSLSLNESFKTEMPTILGHVFNHQTHHRGQVHDQLSQTEIAPPSLDLIVFSRKS